MCFIPDDYLLIATDAENYYVYLDEAKLFDVPGSNHDPDSEADVIIPSDDIKNYLTTKSERKNKK